MNEQIEFGAKVKDRITGYEGTLVGRVFYMERPPEVLIERLRDNGLLDREWLLESRVVRA